MTMVLSWTELLKYRLFVTSQNCIYFRRNLRKNIQFFDVTKSLYFNNTVQDSTMVIDSFLWIFKRRCTLGFWYLTLLEINFRDISYDLCESKVHLRNKYYLKFSCTSTSIAATFRFIIIFLNQAWFSLDLILFNWDFVIDPILMWFWLEVTKSKYLFKLSGLISMFGLFTEIQSNCFLGLHGKLASFREE